MATRYDKRLEDEDLWQVYEIATGRVVMIAGQPYDGMAEVEAAEIAALLEGGILTADAPPVEEQAAAPEDAQHVAFQKTPKTR